MNKEVYEKNIKAYKQRYNVDYEPINNNKYENKLEDTKDGNKTIQIENNGRKIYLHSKYSPIKEAEKKYEKLELRYGTLIIYFGLGLAYYIKEIIKKINKTDNMIIYEPDKELFDIVMKNIDISDILNNINFVLLFDLEEMKKIILGKPADKKVEILPAYKELYLEETVKFMKEVKELINRDMTHLNTLEKFNDDWTKSIFCNIDSVLSSYNIVDFKDVFKDKPIIVVGAGPSLNKNVHLLKEIEGKVCIICCFSAAKVLEKQGITPNFLVSLDSKQYGIEEYEANIPLIYLKSTNKELLQKHKSKKIIYFTEGEVWLSRVLEDKIKGDYLSIRGTVSSFATSTAKYFGASKIILIGQDFCWTKEKIHAEGTVHKITNSYKAYHNYDMEEKDIYGNTVYTNIPFYGFKLWFDEFTSELPENVKLIHATEGGLPIEGAETITLREAIDKYCKEEYCDIKSILNKYYETNKTIDKFINRETVYENIKLIYEELKDMKKLSEEAVDLSKKITKNIKYSTNGLKKNNNYISRLDKIDVMLKENQDVKSIIKTFSNDISKYYFIEKTDNEKLDFAIMNEKLYIQIYEAIDNTIKIAKEEMNYED